MILAVLMLTASMAKAQPLTVEQFVEQVSTLAARVNESHVQKDYLAMLEATQEVTALYGRLGEDGRKTYAFLTQQIDYAQTVAYTQLGRTEEALAAFERVLDSGYTKYNVADSEPDLAPLRENPKFKALLERIKEYDQAAVLRAARGYRADVPRPEFTYQTPEAEGLQALRAEFNLDSIAGSGDEISRIKNLMTWVHNTVRHDGSHDANSARNASALIAYFRESGQGVNCRMLSIILNECYLAMGFSSRFIVCLPQVDGSDSHVINSVWSQTLGKWLWMDASFNAWMTDEAGNLLSIEEVRQRVIDEKPLFLNEEANWNGNPWSKEEYFEGFMLPYLYWFECPAVSAYDMETKRDGKTYVRLCPPGFYGLKTVGNPYISNDPAWFWQKPE